MLRVGDAGVVSGILTFPRVGIWHGDLDLDAEVVPTGRVQLVAGERLTLQGTVTSGGEGRGLARIRVAGGGDGIRRTARPRHYVRPVLRTILTDLAAAAGETLSPTIDRGLLGRSLPAWTVLGLPVGQQLAALMARGAPAGTAWRILPDGTLWVGAETWPASEVDYRELARTDRDGRFELGLDAPLVLPGTVLGDQRIEYVEHHIERGRVWARAWWMA